MTDIFIGVVIICIGVAMVASAFWVQRLEDRERMPGFYTTAVIVNMVPQKRKGQTEVCFEFTKDFRVQRVSNDFPSEMAENWRVGRKNLIVYDEEQGKIYYNPMKKWRNRQALLMGIGLMVLLYGVLWSTFFAGQI